MDFQKELKRIEKKAKKAVKYATEWVFMDLYNIKDYNYNKQMKEESFRITVSYKDLKEILYFGGSTAFSYMITPDKIFEKENTIINYGTDVDSPGLEELESIFEQAILKAIEDGYDGEIVNLLQQGTLSTIDIGTTDLSGLISYLIALLGPRLPEMIEIKDRNYRETMTCPRCEKVLIYVDSPNCCNCNYKERVRG